jgi:hypothetical protein
VNVADVLREVERRGGRLVPNGDRLRIIAPAPMPDEVMARVRQHKPELLRLLRDPSEPCAVCGCGSYWHDGDRWHCEACTPPPADVQRWRTVSGGRPAATPPPALPWPPELTEALKRVSTAFEWSRSDVADFTRWARRDAQALDDAARFLRRELDKLERTK